MARHSRHPQGAQSLPDIVNSHAVESIMKNASTAQRQLGLRIHAIVFVPVIIVLVIVNLLIGSPYWVHWVLLGWGIGLIAHWWSVRRQDAGKAGTPEVSNPHAARRVSLRME
uniref:2TM domain-containing protein n=1 Tax=Neorhizobium sp. EC2-8 TaxID=3129230 RepID=UPI003100DE5D